MNDTSNSQLQNANRNLEEAIESSSNLMDAGTVMIWVIIILVVLSFVAGMCKALFSQKQAGNTTRKQHNNETAHADKQPTLGGKIALGIFLFVLASIFIFVAYVIIRYA